MVHYKGNHFSVAFITQGHHSLQVCFISTDTISLNFYHQTKQEVGAGLNNSKSFNSPRWTFPRPLQEMYVSFHVYNSDIKKLVKYLFLTAGWFWDDWTNISANTVISLKYRSKVEDWHTIHLSGPIVITFSCFSVGVRGYVFHLPQVSWKEFIAYSSLQYIVALQYTHHGFNGTSLWLQFLSDMK